jgi:tetratricopeptide (TPR) repeat protein
VAYAVSAWLIVQVAALLSDVFAMPDWVMRVVVVVLALGFPVAMVLAWLYEFTTAGVKRTEDVAPAQHLGARAGQTLNFVVIAILSVAVILFAADRFWLSNRGGLVADVLSVAILPFEFESQGIAAHFQQIPIELARILSRNDRMRLITADAIAALPEGGSLGSYATQLGARFLVTGQLSQMDRNLELRLELYDQEADVFVWERLFQDAQLQQTSASAAAELADAVGAESSAFESAAIDAQAYEDYLRAIQSLAADSVDDRAEALLLDAIERSGRYAAAYAALCNLYLNKYSILSDPDYFTMAEQTCIRAWTIDSESIEVLTSLAKLSQTSGQTTKARDYAESALAINPNYYDAQVALANTYVDDDPDTAELMYESIVSRNPGSPGALKRLQNMYFYQGRAAEAVEIQRAVVQLVPNDINEKYNLTSNLMLAGEFAEAQDLLESTLADMDEESDLIGDFENNLGTIMFFQGDYEDAATLYAAAIDKHSSADPIWYRNLGDAIWHADGPEAAREAFEASIDAMQAHLAINPDSDQYLSDLIVSYASLGNVEQYEAKRDQALAGLSARDPQVLYSIAVGASRLDDTEATAIFAARAFEAGYPAVFLNADPDIALGGLRF